MCYFCVIDVPFFNEQTYQRKGKLYTELRNTARCSVDNVAAIFKVIYAFLKKKYFYVSIASNCSTYIYVYMVMNLYLKFLHKK